MTPEEWSNLFNAWAAEGRDYANSASSQGRVVIINWQPATRLREWEVQRDTAHYFDKLFCSEIGIKY